MATSLSQQIVDELKPHQVTFFVNNTQNREDLAKQNLVIKKLAQEIPCKIVDRRKLLSTKSNPSLVSSGFSDPRHVTLNVIFDSTDCNHDYLTIDKLAELSAHRMRPHRLIISPSGNCTSETNMDTIFQYAWPKKFLDFSILKVGRAK